MNNSFIISDYPPNFNLTASNYFKPNQANNFYSHIFLITKLKTYQFINMKDQNFHLQSSQLEAQFEYQINWLNSKYELIDLLINKILLIE